MRVCDISHTDPVAAVVRISFSEVDSLEAEYAHEQILDMSKAAVEALIARDWQALAALVPAGLRKKDEKRSAGAKRAAATRKANREAARASQASARLVPPSAYPSAELDPEGYLQAVRANGDDPNKPTF